jgi:hypothetical protein
MGLGVDIEPVVGYERTQKLIPTPHTKDRLVYGARLTAGFLLLSAEAEYLRGTDSEVFTNPDFSTKDTSDIGKAGVRSTLRLGGLISFVLRAGLQAKRDSHELTLGGVTTTTTDPIVAKPYAGAGLRASLASKIAFEANIVAIIIDQHNLSKNEYQATAGFTVHLP